MSQQMKPVPGTAGYGPKDEMYDRENHVLADGARVQVRNGEQRLRQIIISLLQAILEPEFEQINLILFQ
jgi:C4-dicarboxylate-specific signal transduction histidine kinase